MNELMPRQRRQKAGYSVPESAWRAGAKTPFAVCPKGRNESSSRTMQGRIDGEHRAHGSARQCKHSQPLKCL
jgi:hypothetical protein